VLLLGGGRPKGDGPEKSAEDLALERAHSIPE
jgi:hypothetical protein